MTRLGREFVGLAIAGAAIAILAAAGVARAQAEGVQTQTGPRLDSPAGLATDSHTVWVSNSGNNTVTAIDVTSKGQSIRAGKTSQEGSNDGTGDSARFNRPDGMVMVGRYLYLCDTNNSDIRKIAVDGGAVTTIAGTAIISGSEDGKGNAAHFNLATQIATDGSNLFVADSGNSMIREVGLGELMVKTIGGQAQKTGKQDGPVNKSLFTGPRGIATDGKSVYVADAVRIAAKDRKTIWVGRDE